MVCYFYKEVFHLGYTMTEFIDNRLNDYFPDRTLYDSTPFSVENLRDCLLMEIIKEAYEEQEKKQSLRANRGNDEDDLRMRDSRAIKYAQHYRTLQNEHVIDIVGKPHPELCAEDVTSMDGKLEGHKVNKMQYNELQNMSDYPVLKAIISKRICNVKSISNDEFIDLMNQYDELVSVYVKMLDGNDEDVIYATIALFTLEWKYNVELFYACAVEAEKHNEKEVLKDRLAMICAELAVPIPGSRVILHTESRFVLHRRKLVSSIYEASDEEWEELNMKFWKYFIARYYLKTELVHKWSIPEYVATHISRERWAEFFREHYDIRKMYQPKEWNNKRIRYVRKIYETMLLDQPTPKV